MGGWVREGWVAGGVRPERRFLPSFFLGAGLLIEPGDGLAAGQGQACMWLVQINQDVRVLYIRGIGTHKYSKPCSQRLGPCSSVRSCECMYQVLSRCPACPIHTPVLPHVLTTFVALINNHRRSSLLPNTAAANHFSYLDGIPATVTLAICPPSYPLVQHRHARTATLAAAKGHLCLPAHE